MTPRPARARPAERPQTADRHRCVVPARVVPNCSVRPPDETRTCRPESVPGRSARSPGTAGGRATHPAGRASCSPSLCADLCHGRARSPRPRPAATGSGPIALRRGASLPVPPPAARHGASRPRAVCPPGVPRDEPPLTLAPSDGRHPPLSAERPQAGRTTHRSKAVPPVGHVLSRPAPGVRSGGASRPRVGTAGLHRQRAHRDPTPAQTRGSHRPPADPKSPRSALRSPAQGHLRARPDRRDGLRIGLHPPPNLPRGSCPRHRTALGGRCPSVEHPGHRLGHPRWGGVRLCPQNAHPTRPPTGHRLRVVLTWAQPLSKGSENATRANHNVVDPRLKNVRRRPTLPHSPPCSTIGAERLSFRVRNGAGRFPFAMVAVTLWRYRGAPAAPRGRGAWWFGFPTVSREPHSGRVCSEEQQFVVKPSAY